MRTQIKIAALLAVTLIASGCAKKPKTDASLDTSATGAGGAAVGSPTQGYDANSLGANSGSTSELQNQVGDRVFFATDSSELSAEAKATLDAQAQFAQRYPTLTFTLEGHADERGTREYNLALGERRAAAARNYLTALGVDASRITTISYGKERPEVPGDNEAAWAQNRRTVTVIVNSGM